MLSIDIIIKLAKIMLILNVLYATQSKAQAINSSITSSHNSKHAATIGLVHSESKGSNKGLSADVMDFFNIRHERSKQRRHATTEHKQHLIRNLYESRPENKPLHSQYDIRDQRNDDDEGQQIEIELQKNLHNLHTTKSRDNNIGLANAAAINIVSNITSNLNNADYDDKDNSHVNNVFNIDGMLLETTVATHHLAPTAPATATTAKLVVHRIQKLHKKKIVESLRQLNVEKSKKNVEVGVAGGGNGGGHVVKTHHRSLLVAEHLQQQQAAAKLTTEIPSTAAISRQQIQLKDQEKQQATFVAITDGNNSHQLAKESNSNDADELATSIIDTNEIVNADDLTNRMERADAGDGNNDGDDDGDVSQLDNDDGSLSDEFYQNDDSNSNGNNINEAVNDIDISPATTADSFLDDEKFDKGFKNFSSEFLKDIDNHVDLLDDDGNANENETVVATWQQLGEKQFKQLNSTSDFRGHSPRRHNLTEDSLLLNNSTLTELAYGMTFSPAVYSLETLLNLTANTKARAGSSPPHPARFYEEQRITFNESSDEVSYSKDIVMDEAISDNADDDDDGDEVNDDDDDVFVLSELDLSDSDAADTETEGTFEVASGDETNHFLEGVVDAANSEEIYDWDEISRSNRRDLMHGRDVVTKFLQIVETQHSLGSNCEAGTSLNLGEGVVDRYAQDRFRVEAEVAVNRANMLTRIFKMTSAAAQADVNLLHASVLSMVEFDDDIFAAGNCFDWNEHPSQAGLFCPFAYRMPPPNLGAILAKDLSMEYHYLGNTSEWFFQARKNAEKVIARNEQYLKAFHLYSNKSDERIEDDTLAVKYEDGRWSKPYYDCGGGNIWMLTYTVPFFGHENSTYHFKGTSGIDIDLRRVDIDQCPQRNILGSTKPLNIFAGTDKCKQRTTMCEPIQGLGFRRGSYKCVCRKGYYFPDTKSQHKYFNGSLLEEEYEKLMLGRNSTYNIVNEYECLPCAEGCEYCEDGSPCIAALNWPMRTSILALACLVIGLLPPAAWFTFRYQQVKVVRAASPALLRVIALGAFFIYCTNIVMYPNPNLYTCTARIWLREIGFSLTYGALMLKTWRISVIFRVRSAKAVKITDAALLKRLGCICAAIGTCLLVRTLVSPPDVVVGRTADDLKAFLCKTDWWDYTFTSMEVVFLAWGVRLCIMVRKAPSEFNESRFISMAIYNEFLLTCFLNVSMLFLQSPANPDLLYIIFFCHTQLTITLLLALIFGSKVYIVLRSGKAHQENIGMGAKSSGAKFNFRPQVRTFANPSSVTTSTAPAAVTTSAETKLSDQEALEEIRQLSMQLQRIQDMAPPKGVAVMTISSLLDGLKAPANMVMATAAASQVPGSCVGGNQLSLRTEQKPEALALLSLNTEIQKYQQIQMTKKTTTTTTTTTTPTATNNNVTDMQSMPANTLPSTRSTATIKPIAATTTTTTTTPVYKTSSSTTGGRCAEKAVNTEIISACLAEDNFKQLQQLNEHIICQRCYDKCKSKQHYDNGTGKLDKCKILGSPQREGSISFNNIKLDCMCSQSDDLDQLAEEQPASQQTMRRITKRTAATNTPPSNTRKLTSHTATSLLPQTRAVKALSSVSLPGEELSCRKISQTPNTFTSPQPLQQICDNCKNKFKSKTSLGKTKMPATKFQSQQHRKLSRLNSRCNKLIADIENSQGMRATNKATMAGKTATANQQHKQQQQQQQHNKTYDCDEEPQYSTDDIIFYTTTDTSTDDDDDDDDEDGDDEGTANRADDLFSILTQSKSDTRVPHPATVEFKCISLSMGNITTTSTTSTESQPEMMESINALLATNTNAIQVLTTSLEITAAAAATKDHTPKQQQLEPTTALTLAPTVAAAAPTAPTAPSPPTTTVDPTGSSSGKAKRPDKLVLNLNDRSKFTKEVSV